MLSLACKLIVRVDMDMRMPLCCGERVLLVITSAGTAAGSHTASRQGLTAAALTLLGGNAVVPVLWSSFPSRSASLDSATALSGLEGRFLLASTGLAQPRENLPVDSFPWQKLGKVY